MKLTEHQRVQIITLRQEGYSYGALGTRFGVRKATIIDLIKKHEATSSVQDLPRSGRPRISSARQDRALTRLAIRSPRTSSRCLASQWLETSNVGATSRTVRGRLISAGLYSYISPRKPLLTAEHKRKRLQWAQQHVTWTLDQWKMVLFSDETPLQLVQTRQRR